jgi:AcrR family transcriptional regulator
MSTETRPYRKKARAEREADTRRRITESAVELHGTLGPGRTPMSAVAERAGVRRSTLYRHFPDEEALFDACSAHWGAANPPPDIGSWAEIEDPDERLRVALAEIYAYYGRTHRMLENLLRDERIHELTRKRFKGFHDYLDMAAETLLDGRGLRGHAKRRVKAVIGHALDLTTWRSLAGDQSLGDAEVVELMEALVVSAAGSRA